MMTIKAMIFAAGLGTRLYPLTENKPKALVTINGVSLIEMVIKRLSEISVSEIVVNVHHFSNMLKASLPFFSEKYKIPIVISDETSFLSDTGGGLEKAQFLLQNCDAVLIHNVDIITNMNLKKLVDEYWKSGADAMLCVRQRQSSRYLWFNAEGLLCGWENIKTGEIIKTTHWKIPNEKQAFSGIHIVSQSLIQSMNKGGAYSIIPTYLQWAETKKIIAYPHSSDYWMDLGKYDDFLRLASDKTLNLLNF